MNWDNPNGEFHGILGERSDGPVVCNHEGVEVELSEESSASKIDT